MEINPRYTASVELVEYALKCPFLADHSLRFRNLGISKEIRQSEVIAKQIVYAPVSLRIDRSLALAPGIDDPWKIPACSDLPLPGSEISAGEPICTLLTTAANRKMAVQKLADAEQSLLRDLCCIEGGDSK